MYTYRDRYTMPGRITRNGGLPSDTVRQTNSALINADRWTTIKEPEVHLFITFLARRIRRRRDEHCRFTSRLFHPSRGWVWEYWGYTPWLERRNFATDSRRCSAERECHSIPIFTCCLLNRGAVLELNSGGSERLCSASREICSNIINTGPGCVRDNCSDRAVRDTSRKCTRRIRV